jgi:hypothetical protein
MDVDLARIHRVTDGRAMEREALLAKFVGTRIIVLGDGR